MTDANGTGHNAGGGAQGMNTWSYSIDGIESPKVRALYDFWKLCADGRDAPLRTAVHLEEIPDLLPYILVVGFEPETEAFHYMMVGNAVEEAMGISFTKLRPDQISYDDPEEAEFWRQVDLDVVVNMRPVFGVQWNKSVSGLVYPLEFASLPMLDDDGVVRSAIGLEDYSQMQADRARLAKTPDLKKLR